MFDLSTKEEKYGKKSFKKRSFFWKDENLEIKYLLENISHYPKYIEKLRTR